MHQRLHQPNKWAGCLLGVLLLCLGVVVAGATDNQPVTPLPSPSTAGTFMTDLVRYLTQDLPASFGRDHASLGLPTGVRVSGGVHSPAASCTSPPFSLEAFTNAGNRVLATSSGGAFSIDYAAAGCNCQNPGSDRAWVIASATSANTLGNYVRAGSSNLFVNCTDADRKSTRLN